MIQGFMKAAFVAVAVSLIAAIGVAILFPGNPGIAVTVLIVVILVVPRLLDRGQREQTDPGMTSRRDATRGDSRRAGRARNGEPAQKRPRPGMTSQSRER